MRTFLILGSVRSIKEHPLKKHSVLVLAKGSSGGACSHLLAVSLSLSLQRNSSTVKVSHWKPSTGAIPNGRLEGDASRLMDVKTCLSLKSSCFRTGNYQLEYLSHLTTRIPLFVRSFVRSFFGSPSRFFIPSDILHCLKNSLCEA